MKKKYNDCKKKYTKNYDGRQKRKKYQEEEYHRIMQEKYEREVQEALRRALFNVYKDVY